MMYCLSSINHVINLYQNRSVGDLSTTLSVDEITFPDTDTRKQMGNIDLAGLRAVVIGKLDPANRWGYETSWLRYFPIFSYSFTVCLQDIMFVSARGPFYWHGLTLIQHGWIITSIIKCRVKLFIYSFPNFNGATVKVWEWINNFIPHFN